MFNNERAVGIYQEFPSMNVVRKQLLREFREEFGMRNINKKKIKTEGAESLIDKIIINKEMSHRKQQIWTKHLNRKKCFSTWDLWVELGSFTYFD